MGPESVLLDVTNEKGKFNMWIVMAKDEGQLDTLTKMFFDWNKLEEELTGRINSSAKQWPFMMSDLFGDMQEDPANYKIQPCTNKNSRCQEPLPNDWSQP